MVGVDGCKTGWVAVALSDESPPEAHYLPTIDGVRPLAGRADAVAIDIPIGLPPAGVRAADQAARAFLGPRRHSVFLTPVQEAVEAPTHALATAASVRLTGAGVSRQAYGLGPKILEVKDWLPSAPCPVYEVHPEVSFAVLLGGPAVASKKSWAGMIQRRRALEGAGIVLDGVTGDATVRAAVDDMLDAAIVAWSARRIARGEAQSFPDPPPVDLSGRMVAIWA